MAIAGNYTASQGITPSDSADIPMLADKLLTDAIYIGGAGVVAVVLQDGRVENHTCVAGETLGIRARRVNSTNTTGTLLKALYYA